MSFVHSTGMTNRRKWTKKERLDTGALLFVRVGTIERVHVSGNGSRNQEKSIEGELSL
ncbi:hypothetical protein U0355_04965 [Salimicrobium sp. PL1-032A]|uniref:hypothetical protein n=1 Tax=Salimicrobium sp. PL1-032A TaxID=3095364 RepID=UPI0032607A5E